MAAYLVVKAFAILRWQRGYKDYNNGITPESETF
jgi:hypothetical protein